MTGPLVGTGSLLDRIGGEYLEAFGYRVTPDERRGEYRGVVVKAGRKREVRKDIDGEPIYERPVRIEVTVSPTGRSVQVWINDQSVDLTAYAEDNGRRHQEHYRTCGCLGDSSECCVPDCECHS